MPLPRIEMRVIRSVPKASLQTARLLLMRLSQILIRRMDLFLILIRIQILTLVLVLTLTPVLIPILILAPSPTLVLETKINQAFSIRKEFSFDVR